MRGGRRRWLCARVPCYLAAYDALGLDLPALVAAGLDMVNLSASYFTLQQTDLAAVRRLVPQAAVYLELCHTIWNGPKPARRQRLRQLSFSPDDARAVFHRRPPGLRPRCRRRQRLQFRLLSRTRRTEPRAVLRTALSRLPPAGRSGLAGDPTAALFPLVGLEQSVRETVRAAARDRGQARRVDDARPGSAHRRLAARRAAADPGGRLAGRHPLAHHVQRYALVVHRRRLRAISKPLSIHARPTRADASLARASRAAGRWSQPR